MEPNYEQLASHSAPSSTDSSSGLVKEFVQSAGYSAIQQPIEAFGQVIDSAGMTNLAKVELIQAPQSAEFGSAKWHAQTLGGATGALVPLLIAARASKSILRTNTPYADLAKGFVNQRAAFGLSVKEAALTGFIADSVFRPSAENASLVGDRLVNGAIGGATFSAMTATSLGMVGLSKTGSLRGTLLGRGLANPIVSGAASGVPGGVVSAELDAIAHHGRDATLSELGESIYSTSLIGAGFGVKHQVVNSSSYIRATWAMADARTEAKRRTYQFLGDHDLRHPIQRVGDYFHTKEVAPRPELTTENNPVVRFEELLPKFERSIREKETSLELVEGREARNKVLHEMETTRKEFADNLLTIWHGTSERPGMASFTDAELATPGTSSARVAEIRQALSQSAKSSYMTQSDLSKALSELLPPNKRGEWGENHELLSEIALAKEKFFGYDERELTRRMGMPQDHYRMKRAHGTPVDWLPHETNSQLPGYFHGTVSHSLGPTLMERALLPSSELRLRGIKQRTGESANEQFPRRAVSVTTDFTEAWAYHRHSPMYLTSFPIVLGISPESASRLRPAGSVEPGELLASKLTMGDTMLSRLGLTSRQITHVFAPDNQVSAVERQLRNSRVSGVSVVGLGELAAPKWRPLPLKTEGEGLLDW